MAKAKFDIKFDIKTEATRPLYAVAGVTDLAVAAVRDYVADVQKSVVKIDLKPEVLRDQAVTVVNARVDALAKDAQNRRAAIEKRVGELQSEAKDYPAKVQSLVDDNVALATDAYGDLVKRGESLVKRIRRQEATKRTVASARTTTAKARTTTTQAKKTGSESTAAVKTTARKTSTAAKEGATKTASTAKSGANKTTTTAKKSASTAKKAPARKASTTRSSAKATGTAAQKTASNAAQAAGDAASKVGS